MGKLFAAAALAALCIGMLFAGLTVYTRFASADVLRVEAEYRAQVNAIEVQQRAEQARRDAQFWETVTPVAAFAASVALGVGTMFALAAGAIGLVMLWEKRGRANTLTWPRGGVLPVDTARLSRGDFDQAAAVALAMQGQAAIEAAKQPRLPSDLRAYSPRFYEGKAPAQLAAPPAAAETPTPLALPSPSFSQLLAEGKLGQPGRLLLGLTQHGELWGSWRDLYSTAVGGVSGSGKTTTTRFLAAQSALNGAQFVILDPHADAGEDSLAATLSPLAPSFILDPAAEVADMRRVIQRVSQELDRRMHAGCKIPPLIVAVDEFTSLMRGPLGADLAALVERIGQEGRKYGVFALLSGQIWTAERSGGTELRDSLASAYVHRLKPSQARLLVPDIDKGVARLPVGAAYLNRTNGELLQVSIPNTTANDLQTIGRMLPPRPAPAVVSPLTRPASPISSIGQPRPAAVVTSPPVVDSEATAERPPLVLLRGGGGGTTTTDEETQTAPPTAEFETADTTTTTTTTTVDPDAERRARIRTLASEGVSKSSIAHILWGYKDTRVMRIIADALAETERPAAVGDGEERC